MVRSLLRMLKHISLAIVALVAAVCIAEVGVRTYTVYKECQSGSPACSFAAGPCPINYQQLPPLATILTPSEETGEAVEIATNSFGLRGPEFAVPKSPDVFRVVCLGDDATLAPQIPFEATFPVLVQNNLGEQSSRKVEVINAGIPDYCPLLSLAWARQRLIGLQPDLVILCCDASDVTDDRRIRPLAQYGADGSLQQICHPGASRQPRGVFQLLEREFVLGRLLREQLCEQIAEGEPSSDLGGTLSRETKSVRSDDLQIRQTWEPIERLRDLCHQIPADFVVAQIPSRRAVSGEVEDELNGLSNAAEDYEVPYLDVSADFPPQASPDLFLRRSGALSSAGHHLFAELLSWAIVHRNTGSTPPSSTPSPITPAAASSAEPSPEAAAPPLIRPTPLPNPSRRPRTDETTPWSD